MIKIAVDPYARVSWRGVTVNNRTEEMLCITELRSLTDLTPLRIPQGSYTSGVSQSGGTHAGGGALDVSVRDMTAKQKDTVVWALRKTGFAAWHRLPSQGDWVEHIHAIAIGDKDMSPQAAWQVSEYRAGRNGLVNQASDDGPRFDPIPVYRQAIDMSFYGPEKWDAADFTRLFTRLMDWKTGEFTRPDDGTVQNADVGDCLRAARWALYRLSNAGLDDVARELFTADNIIPNAGIDPIANPSGAFMTLSTAISNMEDTQDKDHATLEEIKTAVVVPPA